MRRSRTTALIHSSGPLLSLLVALAAAAVLVPASGAHGDAASGPVPQLAFPLVAKTAPLGQLRRPARERTARRNRHGESLARARRRGRAGPGEVLDLGSRRLHALSLRAERDDVHVHPPEQRPRPRRTTTRAGASRARRTRSPTARRVSTGQQIAFNGDSGDADGNPHLHFEVHPNGGADVNPFPHLKKAVEAPVRLEGGRRSSASALRGRLVAAGGGTPATRGHERPCVSRRPLARDRSTLASTSLFPQTARWRTSSSASSPPSGSRRSSRRRESPSTPRRRG